MIARRLLIALLLALTISGGFTYLLARRLQKANQTSPTLQYVVPNRDLETGEVLRPEDLKIIAWPANASVNGAVVKIADAAGRATLTSLASGQPISSRQLSAPGGLGLSARIPDGMRAISLRSDQIVGVAGFLIPGTHTDVLVTYRNPASNDAITSTVLQNEEVIAAGQKTEPDPEGKPSTVDVVTLLVTPQDAERVVLASTQGTVHFVLRNGADREQAAAVPMDLSTLGLGEHPAALPHSPVPVTRRSTSTKALSRLQAAPTKLERTSNSIVFVRGDKQTVETF